MRIRGWLLWCTCAFVWLVGCDDDPRQSTDTMDAVEEIFDVTPEVDTGPLPPNCGDARCNDSAGETCCGAECIDTESSALHCGACGITCDEAASCDGGACVCGTSACASDEACCAIDDAPACVAIEDNPQHCGGCGIACQENEECRGGICLCPGTDSTLEQCREGSSCCPGLGCRDLETDATSCGTCGLVCAAGELCADGACACGDVRGDGAPACGDGEACCGSTPTCTPETDPLCQCGDSACLAGELCCDVGATGNPIDRCTDVGRSGEHCGACGVTCGPNMQCVGGTCTCDGGFGDCNGDPTDGCEAHLITDLSNCGTCGLTCEAGQVCDGVGRCATSCQPGATQCGDTCTWLDRTSGECGACGASCASGEVCSGGSCATSCQLGLANCRGFCVDLEDDRFNCGACGVRCAAGQVCNAGLCSLSCETGLTNCDGTCIDLLNDERHCSACGAACPNGFACSGGQCVLACQEGLTNCGGVCVDVSVSRQHCGACGLRCGEGEVCDGGGSCAVECQPGLENCFNLCVDLSTSDVHCGRCGSSCPQGYACESGTCELQCPPGLENCGGLCVDITRDERNCGGCSQSCALGERCEDSTCEISCQAGLVVCEGRCVDVTSDRAHCGGCQQACGAGEVCDGLGACAISCQQGFEVCDGVCVDTQSDRAHCGSCQNACATGEICDGNGACALTCQPGFEICDGACVNTDTDRAHCGACQSACAAGQICDGSGACALSCPTDLTQCADTCIDTTRDARHCGACDQACAASEVCVDSACVIPDALLGFASVEPTEGLYPGGFELIIRGTGFDSSTVAFIGGKPCRGLELVSSLELRCVAPSHTPGTVDVELSDGATRSVRGLQAFTFLDFTTVTTIAGTGTPGYAEGTGDVAQFSSAVNGFFIEGDTLYVADGMNARVRLVDLSGLDPTNPQASDVTVSTLAGDGTRGVLDSSDGTGATAQFQHPDDIVRVDDAFWVSDVYWPVLDTNPSTIRVMDPVTGDTSTRLTLGSNDAFSAMVWDGGDFVYVSECGYNINVIFRIDRTTDTVIDFAGTRGVFGDVDAVGTAAQFRCAYGLDLSEDGQTLYFADYSNNKIKKLDITTQQVTTIAGSGTAGYADNVDPLLAQFRSPSKVELAGDLLFITQVDSCAVRQLDLLTGEVSTVLGTGTCGTADGTLDTATVGATGALTYDPRFGLFVGTTNFGWSSSPTDGSIRLLTSLASARE